jgi:hypothetical protein
MQDPAGSLHSRIVGAIPFFVRIGLERNPWSIRRPDTVEIALTPNLITPMLLGRGGALEVRAVQKWIGIRGGNRSSVFPLINLFADRGEGNWDLGEGGWVALERDWSVQFPLDHLHLLAQFLHPGLDVGRGSR